jgi:hypothetical protein
LKPLLSLLFLAACTPPDTGELFQTLNVETTDAAGVSAAFVSAIDDADETVDIALPAMADLDIANALVAAKGRGVLVRVVTDIDREQDPGIAVLQAAEIPVTLADGAVLYYDFNTNLDIGWASDEVQFTHAFALLDHVRFVQANEAGTTTTGSRVLFSGQMEILGEDMGMEFQQVFGGTDATALDSYDEPSKSITDDRWLYRNQTGADLEVWFGPQERLVKRVIDAVYGARSDIRIVTDDFADDGLARALQEKAADGFSAEVVYGPHFGDSSTTKSRVLTQDCPDVVKYQITGSDRVPTIVLIDYDHRRGTPARAFVLTHDLFSATRTDRGQPVTTDQLIDGSLWALDDYHPPEGNSQYRPSKPMLDLQDLYGSLQDSAEAR